eukprot:3297770-Rhodomonas_salina.2
MLCGAAAGAGVRRLGVAHGHQRVTSLPFLPAPACSRLLSLRYHRPDLLTVSPSLYRPTRCLVLTEGIVLRGVRY